MRGISILLANLLALCWTCSKSSISLFYCKSHNCTQYSKCGLIGAEKRGRITSLDLSRDVPDTRLAASGGNLADSVHPDPRQAAPAPARRTPGSASAGPGGSGAQCPGPARPPLPRAGRYQRERAGGGAARIGLRAPRAGGGRGAGGSGFRAERSHIGQRRAGFWEKGPSPPPPPARPPAKMSDMEDDFMCDDEEDYDLVGRGALRGLSGTAGGAAGAAALRAGAGAAYPPQRPPRRVLPRQGARTSRMSFPPGEEDAGRGCEGRVLLSEQPLGRLSAEEQASPGRAGG